MKRPALEPQSGQNGRADRPDSRLLVVHRDVVCPECGLPHSKTESIRETVPACGSLQKRCDTCGRCGVPVDADDSTVSPLSSFDRSGYPFAAAGE